MGIDGTGAKTTDFRVDSLSEKLRKASGLKGYIRLEERAQGNHQQRTQCSLEVEICHRDLEVRSETSRPGNCFQG